MSSSRYSRNIACIGAEGQRRLSASSVFIIGCGALGGQVAMILAGAGVGRIGIADFDTIDISNLQRQLFFSEQQTGTFKADVLARRMTELNSEIKVEVFREMIREKGFDDLLRGYDFIVDATDNSSTKYMTDRLSRRIGRPACIGGVSGWQGQVLTVSGNEADGSSCFSDIFPAPEEENLLPCAVNGVMGAAASTIASIQAAEALKWLLQTGDNLIDRLLTVNLLTMEFHTFEV